MRGVLVALFFALPGLAPVHVEPALLERSLLPVSDAADAWALGLGVSSAAAKSKVTSAPEPKPVCAIGDADGDGFSDILVRRAPGKGASKEKYEALAGPDFTRSLWRAEPSDSRLMKCGADVTGDAATDPILVTPPPAESEAPAAQTATPIDGATGEALSDIPLATADPLLPDLPAPASQSTSGEVLPAGDGALLVVDTTRTQAGEPGAAEATSDEARVQVVSPSGAAIATVELPPSTDAVAVAAVPDVAVVVLTEAEASPVDGLPFAVPTVTLADDQGTTQWTQQQEATSGIPVVLPSAGDVDGDGTEDVIYAVVTPDLAEAIPSSGFDVLSGADGAVLVDSGAATAGLATALPLGDVDGQGGDEVLVIVQADEGQPLTLEARSADGSSSWTATVAAGSEPVNAEADLAGNTVGFSDLTGDGVPDVAVATDLGDGLAIQVLDGTDGQVAWTAALPGADSVVAVPTTAGGPGDLVAVQDGEVAVTSLDGATGTIEWAVQGEPAIGATVAVEPVGDTDGDGVQDLLVRVAGPAGSGGFHVISGGGVPKWSGAATDGDAAPAALRAVAGLGDAPHQAGSGLAWLGALAALGLAGAALRRRRDD